MRVIFIKDLKGQGKKGEIKEVKTGYAVNYLIKNGYAIKETKESLNKLAKENKKAEAEDLKHQEEAKKLKKLLESKTYKFTVKTGKEDKVFGSISLKQLKEALEAYNIDKKQINLEKPLQTLGTHQVEINLYKDIKALIKVEVTK